MKRTFTEEPQRELIEAEAIRRAQDGDATAFEYLYRSHSKRVFFICLRMLKNTSEAEDVTQQIFLSVFRKIATFRSDSAFSTWLHRVTVNAVLMRLRRKEPTEHVIDDPDNTGDGDDIVPDVGPSDASMLSAVDRLNLTRAVRKLPGHYELAFLLHDVLGYKHSEIAERFGCSVACSKSRVLKARERLRHLLLPQPAKQLNERRGIA